MIRPTFPNMENGFAFYQEVGMRLEVPIYFQEQQHMRDVIAG